MLEIPTNARQAEAIRFAHIERARVFAKVFSTALNPVAWVKAFLPARSNKVGFLEAAAPSH